MILAFYKVANSQGYTRHTFDNVETRQEKIDMLGKLRVDELHCYTLEEFGYGKLLSPNIADLIDDINEDLLNDSWVTVIEDDTEPPMYGFNHEQLMEMVTVTCYNKTTMYTRKAALIFFRRGMACSEGAEHERYEQIFLQLLDGETVCNDC